MAKVLQIINAMYPSRGGMGQVAEDVMRSLIGHKDTEQKIICFNEDAEAGGIVTKHGETIHDELEGVEVQMRKRGENCFAESLLDVQEGTGKTDEGFCTEHSHSTLPESFCGAYASSHAEGQKD